MEGRMVRGRKDGREGWDGRMEKWKKTKITYGRQIKGQNDKI